LVSAGGEVLVLQVAQLVQASGEGQDRVEVLRLEDATVLVVADGSGGMSGGAQAAEDALQEVSGAARQRKSIERVSWLAVLERADDALSRGPGQCAIVTTAILGGRIFGASVGDCEAWLISEDSVEELTASQVHKPLLGTGEAVPVAFEAALGDATLLLATDGLFKYAHRDRVTALARGPDLEEAVYALTNLPRLRSGALPDDVAVILCRR
jgi:serine/threonine protein phosphatase PrpC